MLHAILPAQALVFAQSMVSTPVLDQVKYSMLTYFTAGDQLTVEMHQQPGDRSCANEAIGGDHFGPVQASPLNLRRMPLL